MSKRLSHYSILILLSVITVVTTQCAAKPAEATATPPAVTSTIAASSILQEVETATALLESTTTEVATSVTATDVRNATTPTPVLIPTTGPMPSLEPTETPSGTTFIPTDQLANCRYGVNALDTGNTSAQVQVVDDLGLGWYFTYEAYTVPDEPSNGAKMTRVIHTHQNKDSNGNYLSSYYTRPPLNAQLGNYISSNPNELWVIGNEIERIGQGEIFPDMYAEAYHEIYNFVKSHDPGARIGMGPLVQTTPNRLQYLDLVWQAYLDKYGSPMPIDVWTTHLYILPEVEQDGVTPNNIASVALGTDPTLGKRVSDGSPLSCPNEDVYCFAEHDDMSIFNQQIRDLRQWMKAHGEQNKPLILSEFSILFPYILDPGNSCFLQDELGACFTPQRVSNYMESVYNYLRDTKDGSIGYPMDDNRLVQQSAWYAVYSNGAGDASNLYNESITTQTQMGTTMINYVWNEAVYYDLLVEQADDVAAFTNGGGTASAELSVTFRNKGNMNITDPFKVTFYADSNLTQVIGSTTVTPEVLGCAISGYEASVTWSDLAPGKYYYWVLVDSENAIPENPGGNNNNIATGMVLVNPKQVMLPVVKR